MNKKWLQLNLGALLRGKVIYTPWQKSGLSRFVFITIPRFPKKIMTPLKPYQSLENEYKAGIWYRSTSREWRGAPYSPEKLLFVLEELAAITRTNAPLVTGLEMCAREEHHKNDLLEALFLHMRDDLLIGKSLSESMRRLKNFFPRFCADMVAVGEESGKIYDCLNQISAKTIRTIENRNALRGVFSYFSVVIAVNSFIMYFLFIKVVPIYQELIAEMGVTETPFPLRVLFQFSMPKDFSLLDAPEPVWVLPGRLIFFSLVPVILVLFVLIRAHRRNNIFFRRMGVLALYVPFFRGIFIRQNLLRIATMLKHYLAVGVPLDHALELVRDAEISFVYQNALTQIHRNIQQGYSLAEAIENAARRYPISKSFRSLTALGESSGMLPESFTQISDLYDIALQKRVKFFTELIGPVCILLYGTFIGFFVVGMFSVFTTLINTMIESM